MRASAGGRQAARAERGRPGGRGRGLRPRRRNGPRRWKGCRRPSARSASHRRSPGPAPSSPAKGAVCGAARVAGRRELGRGQRTRTGTLPKAPRMRGSPAQAGARRTCLNSSLFTVPSPSRSKMINACAYFALSSSEAVFDMGRGSGNPPALDHSRLWYGTNARTEEFLHMSAVASIQPA